MAKANSVTAAPSFTADQMAALALMMQQMGLAAPAAPVQAAAKAAPAPVAVAPAQTAAKASDDGAAVSKLLAGAKLVEFRTTAKKGIIYAVVELPVNSSGRAQRITVYI